MRNKEIIGHIVAAEDLKSRLSPTCKISSFYLYENIYFLLIHHLLREIKKPIKSKNKILLLINNHTVDCNQHCFVNGVIL